MTAAEIADLDPSRGAGKHSSCWSNSRPPINGCCNSSVWMGKKRSTSCTTTCGRGSEDRRKWSNNLLSSTTWARAQTAADAEEVIGLSNPLASGAACYDHETQSCARVTDETRYNKEVLGQQGRPFSGGQRQPPWTRSRSRR